MSRGLTIQTKMSLTTARIYCMLSPPLSGVLKDCSIVQVQQLQMLCRRRCCMSASQRMFGSLSSPCGSSGQVPRKFPFIPTPDIFQRQNYHHTAEVTNKFTGIVISTSLDRLA